jgi:hypothetical protein
VKREVPPFDPWDFTGTLFFNCEQLSDGSDDSFQLLAWEFDELDACTRFV